MKGLSIEEKAKRYDEAIAIAKEINNEQKAQPFNVMTRVFPELKESEDERIRKELLEHCKNQAKPYILTGNKYPQIQSWIDWLEKQGEKKSYGQRQECVDCQFNYAGKCKGFCAMKRGEQKPAWSEEDEKIYQSIMDDTVQENQLNDEQTNWIRDIKYRYFPQPKQEWSEEEVEIIDWLVVSFDCLKIPTNTFYLSKVRPFLISLRNKIQPIINTWSEEDEKMWAQVINEIEAIKSNSSTVFEKNIAQDKIDWLKSLKERYTWKPSDEQMDTLEHYIHTLICTKYKESLFELYLDLKKLREELL